MNFLTVEIFKIAGLWKMVIQNNTTRFCVLSDYSHTISLWQIVKHL